MQRQQLGGVVGSHRGKVAVVQVAQHALPVNHHAGAGGARVRVARPITENLDIDGAQGLLSRSLWRFRGRFLGGAAATCFVSWRLGRSGKRLVGSLFTLERLIACGGEPFNLALTLSPGRVDPGGPTYPSDVSLFGSCFRHCVPLLSFSLVLNGVCRASGGNVGS